MSKVKAVGLGVSLLALSACGVSGYSFVDMPQVCETVLADTTQDLRILFMIDDSGSTDTTDPSYFYRVQTLQKFLATYGSKGNFTYSLSFFGGNDAASYQRGPMPPQAGSSVSDVFGNAANFADWLQAYTNKGSGGQTPYGAAFRTLRRVVEADEAAGSTRDYIVVFLSDGAPSDLDGPRDGNNQLPPNNNRDYIEPGIRRIVSELKQAVEANGKSLLTVSTVYFGSPNAGTAKQNLALMASEGAGQFLDTNGLTDFSIDDIIQVPRLRCVTPGRSDGG